jgi:hypothetical protein
MLVRFEVDLDNIPEDISERVKQYTGLLQDTLVKQDGMTNFCALYAALLLAGAQLAVMCPTEDDPRLPVLLGWAWSTMYKYQEKTRERMFHKQADGIH